MPVQMVLCGFGAGDGAALLGLHGVAMFAPGLVAGRLIERFGARRMVCAGGLLSMGCAALSLGGGPAYPSFAAALALLGLGWSLMSTGATALLARAHGPDERMRAQAANDFLVFGAVACASLGSGVLQGTAGWLAVNMAVVPPILLGLGLVLWHRPDRARPTAA
jgi:MFS family permease